jgi:hypothetical protein
MRIPSVLLAMLAATACGRLQSPVSTTPTPVPAPTTTAAPVPATPASPSTFVATTSDARVSRVVDVREGLAKAAAFKAVSDFLTQKYSIDVSDPKAGYLMTPWINPIKNGVPDLRYRSRIVIRFVGDAGKQVSIRCEANWQKSDADEWDVGYDTQMLEDAVVDVRTRIGKTA